MEKHGLLKRVTSKRDRRRNNLVLTKKGSEINEKLCGIVNKFKADCESGIPKDDLATFKRVFKQIVENCAGDQF
jgi:DNA-binding MarR family transcriptional regulator